MISLLLNSYQCPTSFSKNHYGDLLNDSKLRFWSNLRTKPEVKEKVDISRRLILQL